MTNTSHTDLSHNYGCRASLTSVVFTVPGATIRAARFFRADMPTSGKVEIYIVGPDGMEEFLGYVGEMTASRATMRATHLIQVAEYGASMSHIADRARLLELDHHANSAVCA